MEREEENDGPSGTDRRFRHAGPSQFEIDSPSDTDTAVSDTAVSDPAGQIHRSAQPAELLERPASSIKIAR